MRTAAPLVYGSAAFQWIYSVVAGTQEQLVQPNRFSCFVDSLYVVLVSFSFYAESKIYERSELSDAMLNMIFALFLCEFSFKLVVLGPKRYWKSGHNKADLALCLGTAMSACFGGVQAKRQVGTAIILRRIISQYD